MTTSRDSQDKCKINFTFSDRMHFFGTNESSQRQARGGVCATWRGNDDGERLMMIKVKREREEGDKQKGGGRRR